MGTRGLYGFRKDGLDKTMYNHSDSYPEELGIAVVNFVKDTPYAELCAIFDRIVLVNDDTNPTKEQAKECEPWTNLGVSTQSEEDWYCLLRNAQGDLSAYRNGLRYMLDGHEFIQDSLFCEWGYIINLDTKCLEVWRGKQMTPQENRYYDEEYPYTAYFNCACVAEFPLDGVPEDWAEYLEVAVE